MALQLSMAHLYLSGAPGLGSEDRVKPKLNLPQAVLGRIESNEINVVQRVWKGVG